MTSRKGDDAAGAAEAVYWWTHTTLEEEVTTPDATAAEATGTALATVVDVTKELLTQQMSAAVGELGEDEERRRLYTSLRLSEKLPPLLAQVRRTMERAWWERRGEEDEAATSATANHHHGSRGQKSAAAGGPSLDARTREKLEEVQRQVFSSFFKSVLRGAMAAVEEREADETATGEARAAVRGAFAVCLDGLLTDMLGLDESAPPHTRQKNVWQVGLMPSLRKKTTTAAATVAAGEGADEDVDEQQSLHMANMLVDCILVFLTEELPLTEWDRVANFPLLCGAANRHIGCKLQGLTTTANDLVATLLGTTRAGGSEDEASPLQHVLALSSFFQFTVAPALLCIGDGLLSRDASEHAAACAAATLSRTPLPSAKGDTSPMLSGEAATKAELSLLFRTASLTAVTSLASGKGLLDAVSGLLQVCHAGYTAARRAVEEHDTTTAAGEEEETGKVGDAVAAASKSLNSAYRGCLGRQAHALVAVLAQHAATHPLVLPAIHTILAGPYSANTSGGGGSAGSADYRLYIEDATAYWQKRTVAVHSSANNNASGGGGGSTTTPWRSFADVCLARSLTLLPSVLENPPDAIFTFLSRPLQTSTGAAAADGGVPAELDALAFPCGLSLLLHPVTALQRLLAMATTSPALLTRSCAADGVVTESGGGSERRGKAFREATQEGEGVGVVGAAAPAPTTETALIFFPKLYTAFCAVEASLRGLLLRHRSDSDDGQEGDGRDGSGSGEGEAAVLVGLLSAALRKVLRSTTSDTASDTAAGELYMFIAFALSPTPAYPTEQLLLVRQALRKAMDGDGGEGGEAGGETTLLLLRHLQRHVVRHHRLGLLSFFLPLLRALGLDHGAATDREHVAAGVSYPASAAVAYLGELPRGYFCRSPLNIAVNQKDDALAYVDCLAFASPSSSHSENVELFVDLISEAGKVALGRLYEILHSKPAPAGTGRLATRTANASGTDISSQPVFSAVFTPSVTAPLAVDVATNVFLGFLRLCVEVGHWERDARAALQKRIVARVVEKLSREKEGSEGGNRHDELAVLPMDYLLREAKSPSEDAGALASSPPPPPQATEDLSAFERWLWAVELDAVDDSPYHAVKGLVRICNVSYMKQVSTRTLLRMRSVVEHQAEAHQARRVVVLDAIDAAVEHDLGKIRHVIQARGRVEEEKTKGEKASTNGEKEEEERHKATAAAAATTNATPAPAPLVLTLTQVQSYVDYVFNALLLRGRLSVVDAALCGIALEKFLHACARHHVDPKALIGLLRVFLARLRAAMAVSLTKPQGRCVLTRQEANSLSILLCTAGCRLALPYKMSFAPPSTLPSSAAAATLVPYNQTTKELVAVAARLFPSHDEGEAVNTLAVALDDVAGLVKLYLGRVTFLADWCAYAVVLHCRRLLRLVGQHDAIYNNAVAARRDAVRRSGIPSPGLQALAGVERPLEEGLTSPASAVAHLYTQSTTTTGKPTESGSGREERHRGRGGGREDDRHGRLQSSSGSGKRRRSEDRTGRDHDRDRDRDRRRDERDQHRDRERGRESDRDRRGRRRRDDGDGAFDSKDDHDDHRRGSGQSLGWRSRRGGSGRRR